MTAMMLQTTGQTKNPARPRTSDATASPSVCREPAAAGITPVGCPHFGHDRAISEMSWPQYVQNAIARPLAEEEDLPDPHGTERECDEPRRVRNREHALDQARPPSG